MPLEDLKAPTVSVIIPAFRVAEWVGEAIESVLRQTYSDWEIFVVDQDLDDAMAKALAPFRDRIIHLPLHRPSLPAARNLALRQARGRIIAQLDGDDVWEPNALAVLVGMLDADPTLDAVSPNAIFFGEPETEGALFQNLFPAVRPITYEDVVSRRSYIFGGLVYRKAAAERVGYFDESIAFGEDFDLWIRMLRAGSRFDFTELPVYRYRRRPTAMCHEPVIGRIDSLIGIYDKQLAQPGLTASQRAVIEDAKRRDIADQSLARAKLLISSRDFGAARKALDAANEYRRSMKLAAISMALRVAPSLVAAVANRK